jgi:hypothetical protein
LSGLTTALSVAQGGTGVTTSTGTGSVVLSDSPTLVTPNLGTPASGVVTNLTGTASININGTVGATTPNTGNFTALSASGTVSGTGFSTYLASPPAIGGTAPAAGTFTTLIGGGGSVNYAQITGGAATKAVQFQTLGSDSNISMAFQPKGTGAIDLAAGSSGVNISNGGTVTAITGTTAGSYTTTPTFTISAPTTSGGVQATGTVTMQLLSASSVASGGTGYTLNDVITLSGGTSTTTALVTVSAVSGGVVTGITLSNAGVYTVLPSNPISTTGGTGTGLTLTGAWGVRSGGFTITAAGSGYVEQPTITFSSGTAAAYATVGSGTVVRSLGTTMSFYTPGGEQARIDDTYSGGTAVNYVRLRGRAAGAGPIVYVGGSDANTTLNLASAGTGSVAIGTNSGGTTQMQIAHTASAVNYVQVTGAVTTGYPTISAQGSDANPGFYFQAKGTGNIRFSTNGANSNEQFRINNTASAVNYLQVTGSAAGAAPVFSVAGTDTNIDLSLTPKGTGLVRFGTYTAGITTATGYINIKAADGTTYKMLVST